jgi:uncharacterized protein YbjT (DUF2867 family)
MSNLLISGATGDIGARVVRQLLALGHRPRIFVRTAATARQLFGDTVDIHVGDLADPVSLAAALAGAEKFFLVTSGPAIPTLDALAAHTAKAAGVHHLVKLSSLDAEHHLALGRWHALGESAIRATGIPYTFIRPTGFMSNLLAWAHSITTEAVVRSSTGHGKRPFIHSDDIAAVSVQALTTTHYLDQTLSITGPEALSFPDVTSRIATTIGTPLRFEPISDDEAAHRYAAATAAGPEETAAHVELWRAIRENRLSTVTPEVHHLLGRPPLTLDHWLAENASSFQKGRQQKC